MNELQILEKENLVLNNKRTIADKIYTIRGVQVMLDSDLAELYGYETKAFNQQVKRNIERFPSDFMFQLTIEEAKNLPRSQIVTLEGKGSNIKYAPYVFTEQGVYMLAAVLKSEIAIQQSIAIMRVFKEMRHFIIQNQSLVTRDEFYKLSLQVEENTKSIEQKMVTKDYFDEVMKEFVSPHLIDEYIFLNGEKFAATLAYEQIYGLAKQTIYIVDNYIGPKTLIHLKDLPNTINTTIFSDNIRRGLSLLELQDFQAQYPDANINFQTTNGKFHDRYIIIDFGTDNEIIYHCGASSKDAGNRITSINRIKETSVYSDLITELLSNPALTLI